MAQKRLIENGRFAGRLSLKQSDSRKTPHLSVQQRLGRPMKKNNIPVHKRLGNFSKIEQGNFSKIDQNFARNVIRKQLSQDRSSSNVRNIKTKNNMDPLRVQINGAIVRGLRSDQLVLQKIEQQKKDFTSKKLETISYRQAQKRARIKRQPFNTMNKVNSKVSLSLNRGLTVNIRNEAAEAQRRLAERKKLTIRRVYTSSEESESDMEYADVPSNPLTLPSRRQFTETTLDNRQLDSLMKIAPQRPPPPKPHRQILDPQVQKEIATLQGKAAASSASSGPGPGVKGFKMVPIKTGQSLNQRFTQDGV